MSSLPQINYRLQINVVVEEVNEHGGYTGGRLQVNEQRTLNIATFDDIARVLGRFHQLNNDLKQEGVIKDE